MRFAILRPLVHQVCTTWLGSDNGRDNRLDIGGVVSDRWWSRGGQECVVARELSWHARSRSGPGAVRKDGQDEGVAMAFGVADIPDLSGRVAVVLSLIHI